jgi:ClpP class serine protease
MSTMNATNAEVDPPVSTSDQQFPDGLPSMPSTTSSEVPEQVPPPPHIFLAIAQLDTENLEAAFRRIAEDVQSFIDQSEIAQKYNFLFLYNAQSSISERTSNKLYAAASSDFRDPSKPILLLLHTRGGSPVPAYLISRYLKTSTECGFVVSVPRRAKSAGTLIALGAREIHMGMMSELGPVDPQFRNLPALGLGTALDYIAGVCEKHPTAADMLATYLQKTLSIQHLGLYERVSESATHYAQKLLSRDGLSEEKTVEVAHQLVYGYKDHSFAIDCDEIKNILGEQIVKIETPEYKLANQIHQYMEQVNLAYSVFHRRYCSVTGRADALSLEPLEDE